MATERMDENTDPDDEMPSGGTPRSIIDMLGFDPRELNMLGFDLDDDEIATPRIDRKQVLWGSVERKRVDRPLICFDQPRLIRTGPASQP